MLFDVVNFQKMSKNKAVQYDPDIARHFQHLTLKYVYEMIAMNRLNKKIGSVK